MHKPTIIYNLRRFLRQRPGLLFGNYGDWRAYRAEIRDIGKSLKHAETMLRYIEWHDSISADMIIDASKHAYSGRLTIGADSIDYCAGQYWPTEYRRAVCAVLASVLWDYWRDACGYSTGDAIRKHARAEFGRSIADTWFN